MRLSIVRDGGALTSGARVVGTVVGVGGEQVGEYVEKDRIVVGSGSTLDGEEGVIDE